MNVKQEAEKYTDKDSFSLNDAVRAKYIIVNLLKELEAAEQDNFENAEVDDMRVTDIGILQDKLEATERNAFARITELIGELSWGIELPSPMTVYMQELGGEPQKIYAVDSKNYEVVFDTIFNKLKTNPDYQPYIDIQEKLKATERKLAEAEKVVEHTKTAINNSWETYYESDDEYSRAIPMDAYLELEKALSDYEASKGGVMKLPTSKWVKDFSNKVFRGYEIHGAGILVVIYKKITKPTNKE